MSIDAVSNGHSPAHARCPSAQHGWARSRWRRRKRARSRTRTPRATRSPRAPLTSPPSARRPGGREPAPPVGEGAVGEATLGSKTERRSGRSTLHRIPCFSFRFVSLPPPFNRLKQDPRTLRPSYHQSDPVLTPIRHGDGEIVRDRLRGDVSPRHGFLLTQGCWTQLALDTGLECAD